MVRGQVMIDAIGLDSTISHGTFDVEIFKFYLQLTNVHLSLLLHWFIYRVF